MRKIWKKLKAPWNYMRSHLGFMLVGAVGVLLLAIMVVFQTYLKNQYYNYLLSEAEKTEQVVMDSTVHNMNNILSAAVRTASEVAIDSKLHSYAEAVLEDDTALASSYTEIVEELSTLTHADDNMVAITLATEDRVILEYGQYWYGSQDLNLWRNENLDIISDIYDTLSKQLETGSNRRFCSGTEPRYHNTFPDMQLFHIAAPLITGEDSADVQVMVIVSFRMDTMVSGVLNQDNQSGLVGYISDSEGTIFYHQDDAYEGYSLNKYQGKVKN
ncbi:MAG: cache domain-containing protein, partial [Clostridiales bacterium]|nr:cache domain-containing protein [Clostridiales bacterium]